MVYLDYLESFQVIFALWCIVAIGFICIKLKQFTAKSIRSIQRVVFLVPVPALLFREIAISNLDSNTWKSLAHAAIISVIMNILSAIYAFFTKKDKNLIERFVDVGMAYCQSEFTFYSFMFATKMMSEDLIIHAALAQFFQFIVVIPFHMILALFFVPDCVQNLNKSDEDETAKPKETPENIEEHESSERELSDDVSTPNNGSINLTGNPETVPMQTERPVTDETGQPTLTSSEPSNESESTPSPPPEKPKSQPKEKKPWTRLQFIAYAFGNQFNICAILGIIWSAIGFSMPSFLSTFVSDLESAIFGAGLFCNGAMIGFHPFSGAPILDVVVGCIMHFVVQPLLSIAFSLILSIDKSAATLLIFTNLAPTSSYAVMNADKMGLSESCVTYTNYWTTCLTLPVFIIWLAIINELGIFE